MKYYDVDGKEISRTSYYYKWKALKESNTDTVIESRGNTQAGEKWRKLNQ